MDNQNSNNKSVNGAIAWMTRNALASLLLGFLTWVLQCVANKTSISRFLYWYQLCDDALSRSISRRGWTRNHSGCRREIEILVGLNVSSQSLKMQVQSLLNCDRCQTESAQHVKSAVDRITVPQDAATSGRVISKTRGHHVDLKRWPRSENLATTCKWDLKYAKIPMWRRFKSSTCQILKWVSRFPEQLLNRMG